LEVRASVRRPVNALTRLDFPTLDRPTNAISGNPSGASADGSGAPATKRASAAKSRRLASAKLASTGREGKMGENVVPGGPKGAGLTGCARAPE
jgi:hypothetical protein